MTQDEILSAAKEAGSVTYSPPPMRAVRGRSFTFDQLEAFAKIIERRTIELCAVVAEESTCECCWSEEAINASNECAAAIRKLGEE